MIHSGSEMLHCNKQCDLLHCSDHGVGLPQFVRAVAVPLQHLLQAAHLTLDPPQTLQKGLALLRGPTKEEAAFRKFVLHATVILPGGNCTSRLRFYLNWRYSIAQNTAWGSCDVLPR